MNPGPMRQTGHSSIGLATPSNLPRPLSSFVGRERALAAVSRAFAAGHRLVTILGGPGLGKTRLALQWAEDRRRKNLAEGGVWFCDLTEAKDQADVCVAVGRALSAMLPATATAGLIDYLGDVLSRRGKTLLLLDNFEQLSEASAGAVQQWCARAPDVSFLVTSRERLQVEGESVVDLGPLDDVDATELFQQRARAALGDEVEAVADAASIARLVKELDYIPLAIELAAARSRLLTPAELLTRLSRRFELLASRKRAGGGRHATLRAAIDWSWGMLDPQEQRALAECSVFSGGFTVASAEQVLENESENGRTLLEVIAALRDKSLLRTDTGADNRLSLYASIREYAAEKLREVDLEQHTRQRHLRHYVQLARPWAEACALRGDPVAHRQLLAEKENLLAAYRYAHQCHAASSAASDQRVVTANAVIGAALCLEPAMSTQGPFEDLIAILDDALLASKVPGVDRREAARVALELANTRGMRGSVKESIAELGAVLLEARALDDRALEGEVLVMLGTRLRQQGKHDEAWSCHETALSCLSGSRSRPEALNLASIGRMQADFGNPEEARSFDDKARALARALGDRLIEGMARGNLAQLDLEVGNLVGARQHLTHALEAFRAVGDVRYASIYHGHVGDLEYEHDDLDAAAARYQEAIDDLSHVGIPRAEGLFRAALGGVQAQRGELEAATDSLETATSLLGPVSDPNYLAALEIHRLQLSFARGMPAEAVRTRLAAVVPERPPVDVRFAARMLRRALSRDERTVATPAVGPFAPPEKVDETLVLARDGSRAILPNGTIVDLQRKGAARRILVALGERHRSAPGAALHSDALLAAGWPGERMLADAGNKRVRVAISSLRRLGFARVLLTRDDGYLLSPALRVRLE